MSAKYTYLLPHDLFNLLGFLTPDISPTILAHFPPCYLGHIVNFVIAYCRFVSKLYVSVASFNPRDGCHFPHYLIPTKLPP